MHAHRRGLMRRAPRLLQCDAVDGWHGNGYTAKPVSCSTADGALLSCTLHFTPTLPCHATPIQLSIQYEYEKPPHAAVRGGRWYAAGRCARPPDRALEAPSPTPLPRAHARTHQGVAAC